MEKTQVLGTYVPGTAGPLLSAGLSEPGRLAWVHAGNLRARISMHGHCALWQYGLWSFQTGGTKLERFLPKNQHPQRKLRNFENWSSGEHSKSVEI